MNPIRVVAVTRVLDEVDIIESFIRHTAHYVNAHLIVDNGSRDGTIDIIKSLMTEGLPLTVFNNSSVIYGEKESNSLLFKYASANMHADWVIFLDADEFIDDRGLNGGLFALLSNFMPDYMDISCVSVPVLNYESTNLDLDENIVPERITHRLVKSHSSHIFLRSDQYNRNCMIDNGAHFVWIDDVKIEPHVEPKLFIAHYSDRSPAQILTKAIRGWAKVLAAGQSVVKQGTSYHYKGPFDALRDCPANLLRQVEFMSRNKSPEGLCCDKISYKGGPLLYTKTVDFEMNSVRGIVGFIEALSIRFGRLIEEVPQAREFNQALDSQFDIVTSHVGKD